MRTIIPPPNTPQPAPSSSPPPASIQGPSLFQNLMGSMTVNTDKSLERVKEIEFQVSFIIESMLVSRYEFTILTPLTVRNGIISYIANLSKTGQTELNHQGVMCSRSSSYRIVNQLLALYEFHIECHARLCQGEY